MKTGLENTSGYNVAYRVKGFLIFDSMDANE